MKAKVLYVDASEADILMEDGGTANLYNNQEHMCTIYYQNRAPVGVWDRTNILCEDYVQAGLSEGKGYVKDWPQKQEIDDEMIQDAVNWLCTMERVTIEKINEPN